MHGVSRPDFGLFCPLMSSCIERIQSWARGGCTAVFDHLISTFGIKHWSASTHGLKKIVSTQSQHPAQAIPLSQSHMASQFLTSCIFHAPSFSPALYRVAERTCSHRQLRGLGPPNTRVFSKATSIQKGSIAAQTSCRWPNQASECALQTPSTVSCFSVLSSYLPPQFPGLYTFAI